MAVHVPTFLTIEASVLEVRTRLLLASNNVLQQDGETSQNVPPQEYGL